MARRFGFWMSLLGALTAALVVLLGAVVFPATNTRLFEHAVLKTVNARQIGTSEAQLRAFATETMAFLRGEKAAWEPAITLYGLPAETGIPRSFRDHMLTVRSWVQLAPAVLLAGGFIVLQLFAAALFLRGFSRRGAYIGMGVAVTLVAAILGWALIDFDSLWMVLHRLLITDGIFPAGEPVMQLFPLSLFFTYLQPVALALGLGLSALALLVWGLGAWQNRFKGRVE